LSPSGGIYDGRTNPYSNVPPPQPEPLRPTVTVPQSTGNDVQALIPLLVLQQQLLQQEALQQQAAVAAPRPTPPAMPQPATSANDRYSTSNGVRTSNDIQAELLKIGYAGPFDVPSLLAAYQRTTNSPVRPL
jgi:hypothetical protein